MVEWDDVNKSTLTYFAIGLQPYKEEICTYYANNDDSKTDITIDGEKLIAPRSYTIKTATMDGNNLTVEYVKNKPQYPKTYLKCCDILNINDLILQGVQGYKCELLESFQKLIICSDAYWKIVGEEIGLSEPWKPDWTDANFKYCLKGIGKRIECVSEMNIICIFAFPTKKMLNAFYENFKGLIERCAEFL